MIISPRTLTTLITLTLNLTLMSACETATESQSPPCEDTDRSGIESICEAAGLVSATQEECDAGAECQSIEFDTTCGDTTTALCKAESDSECMESGRIEPNLICDAEGLVLATEEECEEDMSCRTLITEGPCDLSFETLCREAECTDDGYPSPDSICEAEGLVFATREECDSGVDCRTLEFEIAYDSLKLPVTV